MADLRVENLVDYLVVLKVVMMDVVMAEMLGYHLVDLWDLQMVEWMGMTMDVWMVW